MENSNTYNMKIVVNRTGLSPFLLRAWETRYKAVTPSRTESNRRMYSENDITKLSLLKDLTEMGFSIGSIANLNINELDELKNKSINKEEKINNATETKIEDNSLEMYYLEKCLRACDELNSKELEILLMKASVEFPQKKLIDGIIVPLMTQIGEDWRNGSLRVVSEHLAASVVKKFLLNLVDGYRIDYSAPSMIVSTPYGQYHEIGALIGAAAAAAEGWNVTYLGASLPAEEIAMGARKLNSQVIFLSVIYPYDDPNLKEEIRKLGIIVNNSVQILVSGQGYYGYQKDFEVINAELIDSHEKLHDILLNVRNNTFNRLR